jgi:acyl-CoA synthetase (AMP-forming)/AMP-acid ligase II
LLQFTSGSTAEPKGVVLTHANLHANVNAIYQGLSVTRTDVGVSWLPLYHDMGLIGMLIGAVYAQVDSVMMSPTLFLKRPTAWLDALSRYRGTISFAPNFAYEICLRRVKPSQIEALDLSSWRVASCPAMAWPSTPSRSRSRAKASGWMRWTGSGWFAIIWPYQS